MGCTDGRSNSGRQPPMPRGTRSKHMAARNFFCSSISLPTVLERVSQPFQGMADSRTTDSRGRTKREGQWSDVGREGAVAHPRQLSRILVCQAHRQRLHVGLRNPALHKSLLYRKSSNRALQPHSEVQARLRPVRHPHTGHSEPGWSHDHPVRRTRDVRPTTDPRADHGRSRCQHDHRPRHTRRETGFRPSRTAEARPTRKSRSRPDGCESMST